MGAEETETAFKSINGLTAEDINKKGSVARKAILEKEVAKAKEEVAKLEPEVAADKNFADEIAKIAVECSEVAVEEGANFEGKGWGTVGRLATTVTIKNGSSYPVQSLSGFVIFVDETGKEIRKEFLGNLKTVDGSKIKSDYRGQDLEIAPGANWQGIAAVDFSSPDKKLPYPSDKRFTAKLDQLEIKLKSEVDRNNVSVELRAKKLDRASSNLKTLEDELAALK